jgi:telomerase reverse transcriptase
MAHLPQEKVYRISKHLEIKPGEGFQNGHEGNTKSKPMRKWASMAHPLSAGDIFYENLGLKLAIGKRNTVFVENVVDQFRDRDEMIKLLAEHVGRNMIKIGKKFYRQKRGIPQGSVLSSMLCNYFYADLEATHLSFLQSEDSLLLRLIDDFLLITTNQQHAMQFLQIMHAGLPEYGVVVNPSKSLVNFEASISGKKIARQLGSGDFPYCGSLINTKTLNITKDRERRKDKGKVYISISGMWLTIKRHL